MKKQTTEKAVVVNLDTAPMGDVYGEEKNVNREKIVEDTYHLFKRYYEGTREFRDNCRRNEEYWKGNHWHNKKTKPGDPKPTTPMIFSMVDNLHSDIMDQYPEPNLMPVEPGDDDLAEEFSVLVDSILERRKFKHIYRDTTRKMLKRSALCWEVIWDTDLYGGNGDVNVLPWDIRYFLWEPGVEDIQDGESVIKFSFKKRRYFKERYPDAYPKMRPDGWRSQIERYNTEDPNSDDDAEMLMMERWYKSWDPEAKQNTVHMIRIAGYEILYWSEEKEGIAKTGVYRDGLYPFVVMPLYPMDDTPIGFSLIDLFRDNQDYIDKLDQIVLKNALMAGKLRLLKSPSCSIPLEKLADWGEETLEGQGISGDNIRWFQAASLPSNVQQHLLFKMDAMKEESGQNLFNRGEGGKGVTAASGIIALQEAGNKRIRNLIDHVYDYYAQMVWLVISRIVQFYDKNRKVRIDPARHMGLYKRINKEGGDTRELSYSEKVRDNIEFDIQVKPQRQSAYQSVYINDIALKLREMGVINEVELLEMMQFVGKDRVRVMVKERQEDEKLNLINALRSRLEQLEMQLTMYEGKQPQQQTV